MDKKRIIRVGAIVMVAGATGFFMQANGPDKAVPRAAAAVAAPATAAQIAAPPLRPVAALPPTAEGSLPGPADTTLHNAALTAGAPAASAPQPQAMTPPACPQDMALIAQPGAMLDLGLLAPCRPNQRVTIRHGGLVITGKTSAAGTLVATIPALQSPAEVAIFFADGTDILQTVEVADLARYDRFAVQWMQDDAFQLHALQAGATYGTPGHVSADTPHAATAEGGFLSLLGDASADRPLLAQVYTWPAGVAALSGKVNLSVEAAVTATTCGREILGETLQLTGGKLVIRDLTIAMPGCEATGDYVVLDNPVSPERLAAN